MYTRIIRLKQDDCNEDLWNVLTDSSSIDTMYTYRESHPKVECEQLLTIRGYEFIKKSTAIPGMEYWGYDDGKV